MKIIEKALHWATLTGMLISRTLLPLVSDRTLAFLLRRVERILYIFTGDEYLTASVAEVAEIFELGPPYSSTVRKIVASMETDSELAASAIECLRKPSPYGVD